MPEENRDPWSKKFENRCRGGSSACLVLIDVSLLYCDVPRARAVELVWLQARERHHYLFPWGPRQYRWLLSGCPALQHSAGPDSPWWIVSSARRWVDGHNRTIALRLLL